MSRFPGVVYGMTGRWREENWFRYGRAHLDPDSLDSSAVTPDDPGRTTPSPAKKTAAAVVRTARKALADAEAECHDRKPKVSGFPCRQDCSPTR